MVTVGDPENAAELGVGDKVELVEVLFQPLLLSQWKKKQCHR